MAGKWAALALGAAASISAASGCGGSGGGGGGGSGGDTATTSSTSAGGGASSSTTTTGTGGSAACATAADCPATGNPCQTPACNGQSCASVDVPAGTPTGDQITGDCRKVVCDGSGVATAMTDDADVPDDANPCTLDACSGGLPQHTPAAKDTACSTGGKVCDGAGACVACTTGSQCPSGACHAGVCTTPPPDCQTATPAGDVTGTWIASVGDQGYLEAHQTGACVTGQSCEHVGFNCYPLQGGVLSGNQLFFSYTFGANKADATLTLSASGTTLTGELFSDKCNCSSPHTYVKQ